MKYNFKKEVGLKQEGSICKDNIFYPYIIEYIGEDEDGDGSIFNFTFLNHNQEYLEEDIDELFDLMVYEFIRIYKKEQEQSIEKEALTVRFFKNDLNFIKNYSKINNLKYQTIIRDTLHEKVLELKN